MSIPLNPVIVNAGSGVNISIQNSASVIAIKVSNKSQFDLQVGGFDAYGFEWLTAGTENLFTRNAGSGSGEISINAFNTANIANPQSSIVLLTTYSVDEPPPDGAWPVSIPTQTVQATTVVATTLSNEGSPANVLVEDIGDAAFTKLYSIYTDGHALWLVDQSGVSHQAIKINTSGNPLQLGQAGDISEVLGSLTVDQVSTLVGVVTAAAANVLGAIGNLQHILGNLSVDGTSLLSGITTFTSNPRLSSKKIDDGSGTNLVDWTASGLFAKGNPATQGKFQYQADGSHTDFAIAAISQFSGTGNVTVAHGLTIAGVGVTPDIIIPVQNVAGSQTMGYSGLGATNVTIATGAGQAWKAIAIKF